MNHYRTPIVLLATLWLLCNTACKNSDKAGEKAAATTQQDIVALVDSTAQQAPSDVTALQRQEPSNAMKQDVRAEPAPQVDWDKKIIKNATLNIEVKKHDAFNTLVRNLVKQSGGYIAEEQQNKSAYKIEDIQTIRVPVDQFDNLVTALTSLKENVIEQKITSQDVTGDVIDTRSRTEAQKQVRLRYLDLLKQAKNMEDILKVQKEINDIQVNIEAGEGRVNYLTHAAAYSTIQLTFFEVLNAAADQTVTPGFGQKVLTALRNGLDWVSDMLVVLLTLWPLWLVAAIVWWGFKRWRHTKPAKS